MGAFQTIATDFGFHRKPFSNTDAEFFFTNTGYLDAYVRLLDSVRRHCGLLILTGEAGTGKTLLLRKLALEAPTQIKFVSCYSTNLDFDNLLAVICDQLGIIGHGRERMQKLKALKDYLHTYAEQGVEVALLIDEAHHLNNDTLSRLLTLARLRIKEQAVLQVVLSGAPVLEEMLAQQRALHAPLANAVHVRLEPLTAPDVGGFVYRQLQSAGGPPPETLFPAPVIERIADYSKGIPRLINMLCERALLLAQLNDRTTISTDLIDEAAEGLMLREIEPVQPQAKVSPIGAARSAHTGSTVKPLEPVLVRTDEIFVDRIEPSLSRIVPPPDIEEKPTAATDTSRGDERHGLSNVRLQVISLALLAGLLGGAGGAYLLYLHQAAETGRLNSQVAASSYEATQVRTAAPPGTEVKSASLPAGGSTVTTAIPAAPAVSAVLPDGVAAPAGPETTATVGMPPAGTEAAPAMPQVDSRPAASTSSTVPSVPPGAKQEPPAAPSPPIATTAGRGVAPAEKSISVSAYMSNGDLLLTRGDVASARLFYEAAANSGSAAALTAIGRTYDPLELSRLGVKGFRTDPTKAAEWYLKAKQQGDPEAAGQIGKLQRWLAETSKTK